MKVQSTIDELVCSHKLYQHTRKYIPDIHQEVYSQVKEKISCCLVGGYIDNISSKLLSNISIDRLLKQAIYQRIDILAINSKKIAIAIVPDELYPPKNQEYLLSCRQLFYAVILSGRLKHPEKNYRCSSLYLDIVDEYEMEIWQFICKHIKDFDCQQKYQYHDSDVSCFMIWLNSCADILFKKAYANCKIQDDNLMVLNYNQYLDQNNTDVVLAEKVRYLIFQDKQGCFKNSYIRNRPQANFRAIALLIFNGNSMKNIAQKLGVPLQTLYTFYKRCINKYRSIIVDSI